jgi:flagellar biosynthesis/type III secretory pathway protein FliH
VDKNEMSDTPLLKKYIESVDGMAHQSATEIIINLEKKLEAADNRNTRNYYADGYEAGYQAGMAEKKPWVDLTKEELQTIFNYEPNDVKHIAFLVESLCKEKNGG